MKFFSKQFLYVFSIILLLPMFYISGYGSNIEHEDKFKSLNTPNVVFSPKNIDESYLILSVRSPAKVSLHKMIADIDPKKLLLIAGSKFFTEEEKISLLPYFKSIARIENYRDSGAVEIEAYKIYQQIPFQRIIAYHEYDLLRAAQLRDLFNIPGQNYQSALAFRDKILMKELLLKAGIKVPQFSRLNSPVDLINFTKQYGYPVIVKPILGTGSDGVSKINDFTEMETFIRKVNNFNDDYRTDLEVESFIKGTTYHVEGFIKDGQIFASWPSACINHSISLLQGQYVAHHHLASDNYMTERLNNYACSVLKVLPTPLNTAFLLEVFHQKDSDELIFCEVAARVGGGVKEMWIEDFDIDIETEFIRTQANLQPCQNLTNFFNLVESSVIPKTISGWILFPKLAGTLNNIPKEIPFDWVKQYHLKVQPHTVIAPTTNVSDTLASTFITSNSELQFQEHVTELAKWFKEETKWKTFKPSVLACEACASCELCINWDSEEPRNCFEDCPACKSFITTH